MYSCVGVVTKRVNFRRPWALNRGRGEVGRVSSHWQAANASHSGELQASLACHPSQGSVGKKHGEADHRKEKEEPFRGESILSAAGHMI